MQSFIANGRVSDIPSDAVGKTSNGHVSFKFEFVCDTSQQDQEGKALPAFFHVQVYGKQAEVMAQSLVKGSPILIKGEIIQRPYTNSQGQRRTYQFIAPALQSGITFLENKEAANRRKQEQLNMQKQPADHDLFGGNENQNILPNDSYPTPIDADEPF
ncbi:single-stranded DNA-binding protein [Streptococcus agalactiae]|uniref:single-stranded DNA-binding protein n=1 Tax=Streptococcus agalactiae TaxID=1311 RepID=UPI002415462D|nr:single-stranded DNA-binding protein [Streptococcus agalactiae]